MLVVNERGDAPYSEKVVAGWLRSCRVPGIAVAGGYVPGRGEHAQGQEADFIVFTAHACVCIEVKQTFSARGGKLSCPVNGRWSMEGYDGDPVHVRRNDVNPLDQARSAMFAMKALTTRVSAADRFVSALVVVVPHSRTTVTLDKPPQAMMPTGVDVLLGDQPRELFSWFRRAQAHPAIWTADRVHSVLTALGVNDPDASPASLIAEGFPADAPAPAAAPAANEPFAADEAPPVVRVPLAAQGDPSASRTYEESSEEPAPRWSSRSRYDDYYTSPSRWTPPPPPPRRSGQRPSFPAPDPARQGRRVSAGSVLLVAVAVAVLGGVVWFTVADHQRAQQDSTGHPAATSVTATAAPPPPPRPAPERVKVAPMTAPGTRVCYPMQPDC